MEKDGRRTVPFSIHLKESPCLHAGLYDVWHDANGALRPTYTVITVKANKLVSAFHDRMPAILKREDEDRWLSGDNLGAGELATILAPYPYGETTACPVSNRVNAAGAEDDEQLIHPLATP